MKRKSLFITGLLLAAAIGIFLPQFIVGTVESSPSEATYTFTNLGMTTEEEKERVQEILDHIVGIYEVSIDPTSDQVTITLDEETMRPEWIVKSLDAHGFTPDDYKPVKK